MYSIVPTMDPWVVSPAAAAGPATSPGGAAVSMSGRPAERAIPKSMIIAWSSASIMTLAGFRSRCTTPAWWAATSPDSIVRMIRSARTGSSTPSRFRIVARSWPSMYGIVMYLMPSISPRS